MAKQSTTYIAGARIWIPHAETVWEGATIVADVSPSDKQIRISTDNGIDKVIDIRTDGDLPLLRNPTILIGQNDLTSLSYLHEPDVLHSLEARFCGRQTIYTYCGIVLVAINPYAELSLYGPDIIRTYRSQSANCLEPHIFAIAETAWRTLEREKCDLSIIISGESGAGKTVSAKYAMRYFAAVGGNESETQIEKKILASSPIMEAIGNAKTTRNDNSSRFGKFTKLLFRNELNVPALMGASMQTYLLEKSRVVFQADGERNYHIFYQLCAGRDEWPELELDHQDAFRFLNQGNAPNINRVSDLEQFCDTIQALNTLGFTANDVSDIVKTCAAILHLGNIDIHPRRRQSNDLDQEECDIDTDDRHLHLFADILQLDANQLRKWLTTRQIESINELVLIPLNQAAAEAVRDALAKHIYAKLFQHIVDVINASLDSGQKNHCFIGVLDIYGFETFQINSFEQFCINYANEKLQQQFNQHIFKLEQEQYVREGIDWKMIDFYDNQPCIELIESKLGILDLLDEECRVPRGSDESWVGKLNEKCAKYKHFGKSRFGSTSFIIRHFSDTVEYASSGFLEKNRDTISKELVNVLRQSELDICRLLMSLDDKVDAKSKKTALDGRVVISASKQSPNNREPKKFSPSKQHRNTVGTQFRESLNQLINTLHATTPHYVRCIKPNDDKVAFKWEAQKIVQQLRACGVLETVRISAAGFPSRWTYENFYSRYILLCPLAQINEDDRLACMYIVRNHISDEEKYRFGHTQIFFRAGQVAHLEQIRTDTRKRYIIVVQSMVRRFCARRKFLHMKRLALDLQRIARGYLARKRFEAMRRNRAIVVIQRYVRGWLCRNQYAKVRRSALLLQKYGRGMLARRRYTIALNNFKATEIQRHCRGYLARKAFALQKHQIVVCQAVVRRFLARREFKRLKAEARSISHIQKMYKGLENKIISLQQRIDELNKENSQLRQKNAEIPEITKKLESKKTLESELKSLQSTVAQLEKRLSDVMNDLDRERDEKMAVLDEKTKDDVHSKEEIANLNDTNEKLQQQLNEWLEKAKHSEMITSNRKLLLTDVDNNEVHQSYQRVVKEKEMLESENYMLNEELKRLIKFAPPMAPVTHSRSTSNVSSINMDDDFGYSSARNTLELKRENGYNFHIPPPGFGEKHDKQKSNADEIETNESINTSTPKRNEILTNLKLKKILDEEIAKRKLTEKQLKRAQAKLNCINVSTEDSIRASELEMENEKLRRDVLLLRSSINRGVEDQELEAQFVALEEENKRRRDECIQLKSILAQRTQIVNDPLLHSMDVGSMTLEMLQENELIQAFKAQKHVNRQLESELTAITEEHNARILDLNVCIDHLRSERDELDEILHEQVRMNSMNDHLDNDEIDMKKQQNVQYLLHQIQANASAYAESMEENHRLAHTNDELNKRNAVLAKRLRDNGLDDTIRITENIHDVASVIKREHVYQGMFKYRPDDIPKIIQRLVEDLTPRVAITLYPGLPAYILFMCLRYTDLINAEEDVRQFLTQFLTTAKKIYRAPKPTEFLCLWLVNIIKLLNLLKQYGGLDEYMEMNSENQNQQQLKNFDLSEYRQVIHSTIISYHEQIVKQIQETLREHIVSAILEHDEMARGKRNTRKNSDAKPIVEPKSLVNQLEHFYKLFQLHGLDEIFIEQIFKQFFYFICVIAMNNLMLRQELCMWKTGMKIRYNVGCLVEWARKMKMSSETTMPLTPLMQVSSLLQSRKSKDDVMNILELCTSLTSGQVLKIVKSYTPDDCENAIEPVFIEKLDVELNKRASKISTDFTMEQNFVHPLKVVYKYDESNLEEIELPTILNLDSLLTRM